MKEILLIVGASSRAAAFSALRAGFSPQAVDLFADRDLCRLCPTTKDDDYPHGLIQAAATMQESPWMFTGALENYPDIVDRISQCRPLLGNCGRVLRMVRDPFAVAETLSNAGLPHPKLRAADSPPSNGRWLKKTLRSSGGGNIQFVSDCNLPKRGTDPSFYFQQFIEGISCSAVFLAAQGHASLLGVSKQLVGVDWTGAEGFCYCGSIGPVTIERRLQDRFSKIGDLLANRFELAGLFGIDAILADGDVWPIEINPRYTASVEVLERAMSFDAVGLHVQACRQGALPKYYSPPKTSICGKAILFARHSVTVTKDFVNWTEQTNTNHCLPRVADIPHVGCTIETGQPVTTVLAEGKDNEAVENHLRLLTANVQQLLVC